MRVGEILKHIMAHQLFIIFNTFSCADIGQPTSDSRRIFYFSRGKKNLRSFFTVSVRFSGFTRVFESVL
jgi:hypothetical protein